MLVFVAPDEADAEALREAVREYLAWTSIEGEEEALNLDAQQRRQVKQSLSKAHETVALRIRGAYCWLLMPTQPGDISKPVECRQCAPCSMPVS